MRGRSMAAFRQALELAGASVLAEREVPRAVPEQSFAERYWSDPVGFARDCVSGFEAAPYQTEVLAAVPTHRRVAVRSLHGSGKSAVDAIIIWWFGLTRDEAGVDWKLPTTASAWRQLTKYLWPEVHKWGRRIRWDRVGRAPVAAGTELLDLSIKLRHGEAFALASNDPAKLEGAHADQILFLFDEAKAIPNATWDAAEGALSGGGVDGREAFAVATSTPGYADGRFYEIFARKAGLEDWWPRHVKLEEAVAARRVTTEWAEARRRLWGEASALYRNRVLGEFALGSERDVVVPLHAIEAAVDRWKDWDAAGRPDPGPQTALGVDVGTGRPGRDPAVIARRHGGTVMPLEVLPPCDEMELAGAVIERLRRGGRAVVDGMWGSGLVARLKEQQARVVTFIAAAATDLTDESGELRYANCRAAMWWGFRERLLADDCAIMLPDDDTLRGELSAPTHKRTSSGRILVESKEDIAKRLKKQAGREDEGVSTNRADAVLQSFWDAEGDRDVAFVPGVPALYATEMGGGPGDELAE